MKYKIKNKFDGFGGNGNDNAGIVILICILALIGLAIIVPFLSFVEGYFVGWLAKVTIGGWLVKGAAALGITISRDSLPIIGGTLAFVGQFFKPSNVKLNKD